VASLGSWFRQERRVKRREIKFQAAVIFFDIVILVHLAGLGRASDQIYT